jgi:hypothetical protein
MTHNEMPKDTVEETLLERCQREARDFAENSVFPVSPKLGKVLTEIEIQRMDEEIYKVIDQIIAHTLKQAAEDIIELINSVQVSAPRRHANDTDPEKAEFLNKWLMPVVKKNITEAIAQKYGVDLSE